MKKLFLSFVVFSVLLLIGCQENPITDPVSSQTVNKNQNTEGNIIRGSTPLSGILANPGGGFNSFLELDGQIDFTHEKVYISVPPLPRYDISLKLDVNATLTDPQSPKQDSWTISSKSEDVFHVSEEGMYILEKSYPVQDRRDGMVLVCKFIVTTDGVVLNDKWLAFEGTNGLNKVNFPHITFPPVKSTEVQ